MIFLHFQDELELEVMLNGSLKLRSDDDQDWKVRTRSIPSTPISISNLRIREDSEGGLSSPFTNFSNSPPGILTKRDLQFARSTSAYTMEYGDSRVPCINCHKSLPSLCKKCTLERLSFYSRRENLCRCKNAKKDKQEELESMIKEATILDGEKNEFTARIMGLRKEMKRRKKLLEEKKEEMNRMKLDKRRSISNTKNLKDVLDRPPTRSCTAKGRQMQEEECMQLQRIRTQYCQHIFLLYRIQIREACLEGTPLGESPHVRTAFLPAQFLSDDSPSTLSLFSSTSARSAVALLIFSSHLVKLLSIILDIHLPKRLSPRQLSLHTSINKDVFHTELNNLCSCVRFICKRVGVPQLSSNQSLHPHHLLISLFELINQGPLPKMSEQERWPSADDLDECTEGDEMMSNEWDTCDDMAPPLTTSFINPFL